MPLLLSSIHSVHSADTFLHPPAARFNGSDRAGTPCHARLYVRRWLRMRKTSGGHRALDSLRQTPRCAPATTARPQRQRKRGNTRDCCCLGPRPCSFPLRVTRPGVQASLAQSMRLVDETVACKRARAVSHDSAVTILSDHSQRERVSRKERAMPPRQLGDGDRLQAAASR
jgi:hypothetical protein